MYGLSNFQTKQENLTFKIIDNFLKTKQSSV